MAFYFKWPFLLGTIGFSFVAGMVMAAISLKAKHRADTIIGVVWAIGMALGIILIDLSPGYHVDLMSYLFGSILTVPLSDLRIMLGVALVVLAFVFLFYRDILAMSYDEEFARVRGIAVKTLYFSLIGILSVTIVMVIRVVGLILVIALLTIPPFIVEKYSRSLVWMMVNAILLGSLFTVLGLWLSFEYDLTSGAAIILVAGIGFLISLVVEQLRSWNRKRNNEARHVQSM
jgi:zinc transport system permease protein